MHSHPVNCAVLTLKEEGEPLKLDAQPTLTAQGNVNIG